MQLEPIQYEKVSQWLLRKLGITANYRGFHYISHAMYYFMERQFGLFMLYGRVSAVTETSSGKVFSNTV